MEEKILQEIAQLLQNNIQGQLKKPYPAKTFSGQNKPVSGIGRTPVSPRYASGNLYKQTRVYWETDFEDGQPNLVVDFGDADYWEFVNYGRRPGRYPPLLAIDKWVRQKPGIEGIRDEKGRFVSRLKKLNNGSINNNNTYPSNIQSCVYGWIVFYNYYINKLSQI